MVNPPHVNRIPATFVHLRRFVPNMAYVEPAVDGETPRRYKSRIYTAQAELLHTDPHENSEENPHHRMGQCLEEFA
jgi:hypothetical protein